MPSLVKQEKSTREGDEDQGLTVVRLRRQKKRFRREKTMNGKIDFYHATVGAHTAITN